MKNIRFIFGVIIGIIVFSSPSFFTFVHADATTTSATDTPVIVEEAASSSNATSSSATSTPDTDTSSSTATSSSSGTSSTPVADTARLALRIGSTLVGPFLINLPTVDATTSLEATGATTSHELPARSVLALLSDADPEHDEFTVSTLQYYDSFGSFYLKCVTVPSATSTPACDNWTYAINGSFPSTGMDKQTLANNDVAYLFFGTPRRVDVSTTTVTVGQSFTATAKKYDPATDTYSPTTGVTIGATQPDPSNPWSPIVVASSSVDASGQAIFTLNATGTYQVGIAEDYYSPATTVTVVDAPATTTPPVTGGGGGGGFTHSNLDAARAFSFLSSHQNTDGSFNGSILTDWAAIAYATAGSSAEKSKLHDYLVSATPVLSAATDYERHAMALEALGINPYSGAGKDYVTPITSAFDGTQVGSTSQVNDDIFALFALTHAGYSQSDEIIQKIAINVISKQSPDGSWGESPEMTAAASQALGPLYMVPGDSASLGKAIGYLMSSIKPTGGWGDSDATSWVQTSINSMNEAPDPSPHFPEPMWVASNGYYPTDVIAHAQQTDGGVVSTNSDNDSKVWSTSYALVAASNKSWTSLLQNFAKPSTQTIGGGYSGGVSSATSTATSSDLTLGMGTSTNATSTVATSTDATTTPTSIVTFAASSTTPTTTPTTTPPIKKKVVRHVAATPMSPKAKPSGSEETSPVSQTAAAASVVNRGFFGSIWHFITHLFTGR